MSMELYLIHFVFISVCVYFSYRSGYKTGQTQIIEVFLDDNLVTEKQLRTWYLKKEIKNV